MSLQGTWEYLSALAARYPEKPCRPSDDLESFMHVLRKMGAKFHRHDYSEPSDKPQLRSQFHVYTFCKMTGPFQTAHAGRIKNLRDGVRPVDLTPGNSPAFIRLTQNFTALCQKYYSNARLDVAKRRYASEQKPAVWYPGGSKQVVTFPDDDPKDDGLSSFEAFTSEQVLALFDEAVASEDWVADKIDDQMPSREKQSVHSNWTGPSLSRSKASSASRLKRHLEEISSRTAPVDAKRPRTRGSKSSKSRGG